MHQENKINLSIIIPAYNEENYISELFDQLKFYFNYKNIEIIFVNDGSIDNSKNLLKSFKNHNDYIFKYDFLDIKKNLGKGKAIQLGLEKSKGKYLLFLDADLELDTKDAFDMYKMIQEKKEIKCIFGSRYLTGKLKKNNYFFNNLVGKINSLIFNIFFLQSLTDVHCGLKIIHRDVLKKIKITLNDFGIELDLASQIVRNNFFIYEYGVSYYFRTKLQGKKISWLDGFKSLYYLFKVRFIDNDKYTNLSLIYSIIYMSYVGSYFGMGLGNIMFILVFGIIGSIIGLNFLIIPSSLIFLFIYMGSLFGQGNGKTISVLFFFCFGIIFARNVKKYLNKSKISKWL